MAREEVRGGRNTLIYLISTFYALCFLQWIFEGNWIVMTFTMLFWFGGMILLFKFSALLRTAGLGEGLELFRITKKVPKTAGDETPGIIENQLSVAVWGLTEKLAFLYSTCCLLIPIFPIKNHPIIIWFFTVTAVVVLLFIWRTKASWVRPIALITSLILLFINILASIPQVGYYFGLEGTIVSDETAEAAKELKELLSKEKDASLRNAYRAATEWKKHNPGMPLDSGLAKNIETARAAFAASELNSASGSGGKQPDTNSSGNATFQFHSKVDFTGGGYKKSYYPKILEAGEYNITRIGISTNDGKSFETKETFSVTEEEGKKFAMKTPGQGEPQIITIKKKGVK